MPSSTSVARSPPPSRSEELGSDQGTPAERPIKVNTWRLRAAEALRAERAAAEGGATICTDQDGQPSCPICLDSLVAPQMLGCGHVYCATCIGTHASVQRAANRPVNCPCCLRPVAPAELPTEVHAEAAETAASSSTVEAPALSQREQRAFRRAAVRLDLRLCPSCDAPVQKNGGCNHIRCRCGADFQWSRAKSVAKKAQIYSYAKQGAKAVGKGAVGVVVLPVAVAVGLVYVVGKIPLELIGVGQGPITWLIVAAGWFGPAECTLCGFTVRS